MTVEQLAERIGIALATVAHAQRALTTPATRGELRALLPRATWIELETRLAQSRHGMASAAAAIGEFVAEDSAMKERESLVPTASTTKEGKGWTSQRSS